MASGTHSGRTSLMRGVPRQPMRSMMWGAALFTIPLAIVAALLCGALWGSAAAVSATVGAALVLAVIISGVWGIYQITRLSNGAFVLGGAYLLFSVHMLVMIAGVGWVRSASWIDPWPCAICGAVTVVAWQMGMAWGWLRSRVTVSLPAVAA